jgi:hypothetical protein
VVAFQCYSGSSVGGRHQDAWRAALPPEFNGEVDAELELLQHHRTLEDKRYFKDLRGRCAGLTEIRIGFELELDDPRSQNERRRQRKGRRRPERPKINIRFSASELKSISFCYMASENAASQITDLRVMPLLIAKLE